MAWGVDGEEFGGARDHGGVGIGAELGRASFGGGDGAEEGEGGLRGGCGNGSGGSGVFKLWGREGRLVWVYQGRKGGRAYVKRETCFSRAGGPEEDEGRVSGGGLDPEDEVVDEDWD